MNNKPDQLAMLLSTDWYLPFWSSAGVLVSDSAKICVQRACREVVAELIGSAAQYWLVDFSPTRVNETLNHLQASVERCKVASFARLRIVSLAKNEPAPSMDSATKWLINELTTALVAGTQSSDMLSKQIVRDLRGLIESLKDEPHNFQSACLMSYSEWDVHIRNLTPDLPSYLANYAAGIGDTDKFSIIWSFINSEFRQDARVELFKWYKTAALSLTGSELRLPPEI